MKYIKSTKKLISIIVLFGIVLTSAYFVLGGYGQSGSESAPNLEEYGLVGHWNFEEGLGQTISDRSGNGNDGTLGANDSVGKDDPVFVAGHDSNGPGGMGMSFDGVDDYVEISDTDDFLDIDLTIALWIYSRDLSGSGSYYIFDHNDACSVGNGGFDFILQGTSNWGDCDPGDICLYTSTGACSSVNWKGIPHNMNINQWYHVAVTFIASTMEMIFYVDGQNIGDRTGAQTIGNSSFNAFIGSNNSVSSYFNGTIDSVRIYNRALSADEIRMLYNQKKPVVELKFDEGSGTTAHDESFNGNDVTFPATDENKPEWSAP